MDKDLRRKRLLEAAKPSRKMLETTGWMDMAEMGLENAPPETVKKASRFGKIASRLAGPALRGGLGALSTESMGQPDDPLERRLERGDQLSEEEMVELNERAEINQRMMSNPFRDNDPSNREERIKRRTKLNRMLAGEYDD
jgi:hypothetical protein